MKIIEHPSPNHGPRKGGLCPSLIVLHYTAMATAEAALARLSDPAAEVSAHYLIAEDGRLFRLVAEDRRAWHAGAGAWGRVEDVNSASIGIELANAAHPTWPPYPEPQMAVLEALLDDLLARHALPPRAVIAHSDCAPGRKSDPGAKFDWARLARAGRAAWAVSGALAGKASWPAFRAAAEAVGYRATDSAGWEAVLRAVRLRHRPFATGPLAAEDIAILTAMATQHPALDPRHQGR